MNNKVIPTLLIATIMIAGAFAFMPVQQASTVHTSGTTTLAANGIGVGDFASASITADAIAADAITSAEIANDAIGATEIAVGAIAADAFASGAIDVTAIAAGAITDSEIATDAIGVLEIADAAEPMNKIVTLFDGTTAGANTCTSNRDFILYIASTGVATQTLTITDGTSTDVYTFAAGELDKQIVVGGTANLIFTVTANNDDIDTFYTILTLPSATAECNP